MPLLNVYVTDDTLKRLKAIVEDFGGDVKHLAESAVEELSIDYFRRHGKTDPTKEPD
jgi:hypothetical protein